MALPPQKFREIIFLLLYSNEFSSSNLDETLAMVMGELKVTKKAVLTAYERACHILAKKEEIDHKIETYSTDYTVDRISKVEKTILRIGLYELLFDPSLPPLVAISEGIRLTRKFGSPESAQFVNAILDKEYKSHSLCTSSSPKLL